MAFTLNPSVVVVGLITEPIVLLFIIFSHTNTIIVVGVHIKKGHFQIMRSVYVQVIPVSQKLRLQIAKCGHLKYTALPVSTEAPPTCC